MAKKQESKDTGPLLVELQQLGWFRKLNDSVQEGLPDIVGIYRSIGIGFEVKSVSEVPPDGLVPSKGSHPFTKTQVRELKNITKNGGVGLGIIICGKHLNYVFPDEITDTGQAYWLHNRTIKKEQGLWNLQILLDQLVAVTTLKSMLSRSGQNP